MKVIENASKAIRECQNSLVYVYHDQTYPSCSLCRSRNQREGVSAAGSLLKTCKSDGRWEAQCTYAIHMSLLLVMLLVELQNTCKLGQLKKVEEKNA